MLLLLLLYSHFWIVISNRKMSSFPSFILQESRGSYLWWHKNHETLKKIYKCIMAQARALYDESTTATTILRSSSRSCCCCGFEMGFWSRRGAFRFCNTLHQILDFCLDFLLFATENAWRFFSEFRHRIVLCCTLSWVLESSKAKNP